ncbi:unnamed protein product, partial [Prorocentrum cordatum]
KHDVGGPGPSMPRRTGSGARVAPGAVDRPAPRRARVLEVQVRAVGQPPGPLVGASPKGGVHARRRRRVAAVHGRRRVHVVAHGAVPRLARDGTVASGEGPVASGPAAVAEGAVAHGGRVSPSPPVPSVRRRGHRGPREAAPRAEEGWAGRPLPARPVAAAPPLAGGPKSHGRREELVRQGAARGGEPAAPHGKGGRRRGGPSPRGVHRPEHEAAAPG